MASNTSAVLDVVVESKEISTLLKHNKDNDYSTISNTTLNSSLTQSPSLDSFSTIHDMENLSELNIGENSDLFVRVDNPQKHLDTLETYITFRIITKVARIEFTENEYIVRRRYNDFLWLRQKLDECHPFCIVPPLPGKHSLVGQLDRYSKDFILIRMKALNVFISRITRHPILSCNEHFKVFLTANQSDFNLHRKQRSVSTKIKLSATTSTYTNLKYKNIEFDKMKMYLNTLTDKLVSIERISNRVNKERVDMISELQYFYPIFTSWATTEPELANILQNIGHAIESTTHSQNDIISSYPNTIGNPIREFVNYIEVVQETLQKRETYQSIYEISIDELSRKKTQKDKLIASSQTESQSHGFSLWKQQSSDERLEKLGTCIPGLVKKVESSQDNLECANEQLRSDLEQWQSEKQRCLKKILLDFVNKQIEFYNNSVSVWEDVTNKIATQISTK